jgi:hypothetical protein
LSLKIDFNYSKNVKRFEHTGASFISDENWVDVNPNDASDLTLSEYLPEYNKIIYEYENGNGNSLPHYIEIDVVIDDCKDILPLLLSGEGDL